MGRGLQEMANTEQLGSRGEVWLVAQLVLLGLLVFPPGPLEVGTVNRLSATPKRRDLVAAPAMLPRQFHSAFALSRSLICTCRVQALVRLGGVGSVVAGLALVFAGQQSLGNSLSPFPGQHHCALTCHSALAYSLPYTACPFRPPDK